MKAFQKKRAFALVLVLIALVLASSMAVFFLTSVARERLGVNLYASGGEVHHLAGMPSSKVIGLINAATKEGTAAVPVSWASQPGMIRTYAPDGNPQNVYKLYSWDKAVEAGGGFDPSAASQLPPKKWEDETAHYVDINQPINDVYPIVDPRAEKTNPGSPTSPGVEGFVIDETDPVVGGSNREKAPMPVKWLYVLEDGQMVAPSSGSGNLATIPGATASNAIIGRVAYWTDDETCKVNINTASEGAYWDAPHSGTPDDMQFAGNPPTKNEFQRTPGHLAMTSLSAVFPELAKEDTADPTRNRWDGAYRTKVEKIFLMAPRLSWGTNSSPYKGSQAGAYPIPNITYTYPPASKAILSNVLPRPVTVDSDRLYVIADDFWFAPDRVPNTGFTDAGSEASDLHGRLFFLTANSRAPETTLFETPRVSLWPITWPNASAYFATRVTKNSNLKAPTTFNDPITDSASKWITAEERLIAFCGTLNTANTGGGDRYYFQRKDPDSPLNDWNNAAFSAYSKRNRDLVAYMTTMMAKPVPGYGKSLQDSLGGKDASTWIGLNTFNYIRSQVNQYTVPSAYEGVRYSYTGLEFRWGKIGSYEIYDPGEPNSKVVPPLRATIDGKEFIATGTYPTLEEAVVVFYAVKRDEPIPPVLPGGVAVLPPGDPHAGDPDPADPAYPEWRDPFKWRNLINFSTTNGYVDGVGARTRIIRAVMLLDFVGLEPGVGIKPTFWVKVKGNSFRVNGGSIGFPNSTGLVAQCVTDSTVNYTPACRTLVDKSDVAKIFSNKVPAAANVWQLVSDEITVDPKDISFSFNGSPVTIEVYACDPTGIDINPTGNPDLKIYEKTMNFTKCDKSTYPMPMAPRWTMSKRAYRFDANGNEVNLSTTGSLPGSTKLKTTATANPMANFTRLPTGAALPKKYDVWQPYPDYYFTSSTGIPGATVVAGASGPDTRWAWSEYAPTCSGNSAPTILETRSVNTVSQTRSGVNMYIYRAAIAGYAPATTAGLADLDDELEKNDANTDLLRNVSTNFRKRVEAIHQRNVGSRPAYCLEGWNALAPFDHTDPNFMFKLGNSNITADYFMVTTETPLRESGTLLTPYDTVISMVNTPPNANEDRDPRLALISSSAEFGSDDFDSIEKIMGAQQPSTVIDSLFPRSTKQAQWHQFGTPGGRVPSATGYRVFPTFLGKPFGMSADLTAVSAAGTFGTLVGADLGVRNKIPDTGDWTGMPGRYKDGGVLARPDQEYQQLTQDTSGAMSVPYYPRDTYGDIVGGSGENFTGGVDLTATDDLGYFSPNRQVPSPVFLGTLPRSMTTHWQTLAFSPNPANATHPGLAPASLPMAPDHLLLDLLWMPVAEPYPISEQLSTAGKVNLNYRMMPFPYIVRKTALYAVMKNTWITALADTDANKSAYKSPGAMKATAPKTRYAIDIAQTLEGFDQVFNDKDLFRSASQLCEMFLVPKGQTLAGTMLTFWLTTNRLTPDNVREEPYNHIYSRVTTKSNTFTVHWRVQSLRKSPGTDADKWDETRDRNVSELRGSTLIERYIDPNTKDDPSTPSVNEGIPDYATATDPEPLTRFYKWRTVSENYFQP